MRARRPVDLTGEVGIELRVRGSGRQFELEVDDGLRRYERSVSRRAQFSTTAEWTLVRVPFSALRSTIFGQAVSATPIDLAQIRGVGLYMADGQDGPFRIEVDYIRSYAAGEAAHDRRGGEQRAMIENSHRSWRDHRKCVYSEMIGAYTHASATTFNGFSPAKVVHVNVER